MGLLEKRRRRQCRSRGGRAGVRRAASRHREWGGGFRSSGSISTPGKVDSVNAGKSYIPDVPTSELASLVSKGLVQATTDFSRIGEVDAVAICVPTPLDEMKEPDTSFMENAARSVAPYLRPGRACDS